MTIILVGLNLGILWITLHCKVGNGCSYNISDLLKHWSNSEYIRMYAVLNIILIMMYYIPVILYVPLTYKSLMVLRQINYHFYLQSRCKVIFMTILLEAFIFQRNYYYITIKYYQFSDEKQFGAIMTI